MRKVGLTFGVIAGFLLSAFLLCGMILWQTEAIEMSHSEYVGYSVMLVALTVIFIGIKSYRDKHLNGSIRFWKAVQLGLLITGVAVVMYAITWEVYAATQPEAVDKFMAEYQQSQVDKMKAAGKTQEEIDAELKEMAWLMDMYNKPVIRFGFVMLEPMPPAILVTLISAAILRRKKAAPAGDLELSVARN